MISNRTVLGTSTVSIVDALGAATPTTKFSVFGSGGAVVNGQQSLGPEFILAQPTVITEIGGFLNNFCSAPGPIVPCPGTVPLTVRIHPSINGIPDASTVLATFTLSNDDDALAVSYEFVATNLKLGPGSYFALFAAQGIGGFLLNGASVPFNYLAGLINLGEVTPAGSSASIQYAAVRILGTPANAFQIDILSEDPTNTVQLARTYLDVAVLSSATFDATAMNWAVCVLGDGSAPDARVVGTRTVTRDVNKDGRLDLQLAFRVRALVELRDLLQGTTSLRLTCGALFDDDVVIVA